MRLTVLWISDWEAKVIHFTEESMTRIQVAGGPRLFEEIIGELAGSRGILLLGPLSCINAFQDELLRFDKELARKIVGAKELDSHADDAVAVLAKKHFAKRAS